MAFMLLLCKWVFWIAAAVVKAAVWLVCLPIKLVYHLAVLFCGGE